MTTSNDLRRAISAEIYKLKHHSIPITIVLLPLIITVLTNLLLPLLQHERPFQLAGNPWLVTGIGLLQVWGFIQALTVAVVTAQLAGLEHSNNTWRHLFALPTSRSAIYFAKVIVSLGLFAVTSLLFMVGLVITGAILTALSPDVGYTAAIPWGDLIGLFSVNYLASFLIITIQLWAGIYWSGFGPALVVALVGSLLNVFFVPYPTLLRIYPWALPTNFFGPGLNLTGNLLSGEIAVTSVALSLTGSLIVVVFSAWEITRRDVL